MPIQAHSCNISHHQNLNLGFASSSSPPYQDYFSMENATACALNFIPHSQQHKPSYDDHQLFNNQFQDFSSQHKTQTFLQTEMLDRQRFEIDRFITLQNERLRMALQEQRKQQTAAILTKYESKMQFLLGQKQEEISKAANRTMELEQFLKRLETESEMWQRVAKENEEMVAALNGEIERLRESAESANAADDAASCCETEVKTETKQRKQMQVCKRCDCRRACVVMLPCRHMSSCKECEPFLHSCPICNMFKNAAIEPVFI